MDSVNEGMMHFEPPRQLARAAADREDYFAALLMGGELDWPTLPRPTYANMAAGWSPYNRALLDAQAGINAAFARLWGPWYGQQPVVVRQRRRDALGTLIVLADKRRELTSARTV